MNLQVILLKMFPGVPFLDLKGGIPGGSSCVPPLGSIWWQAGGDRFSSSLPVTINRYLEHILSKVTVWAKCRLHLWSCQVLAASRITHFIVILLIHMGQARLPGVVRTFCCDLGDCRLRRLAMSTHLVKIQFVLMHPMCLCTRADDKDFDSKEARWCLEGGLRPD